MFDFYNFLMKAEKIVQFLELMIYDIRRMNVDNFLLTLHHSLYLKREYLYQIRHQL